MLYIVTILLVIVIIDYIYYYATIHDNQKIIERTILELETKIEEKETEIHRHKEIYPKIQLYNDNLFLKNYLNLI